MNTGGLGQRLLGEAGHLECGANAFDRVINHESAKSIFAYAFQAPNHTEMCMRAAKIARMEKTPDQKRDILRRFIADNGLKIARWAKSAGVDKNSIYNFLNSHSNGLDPRTYAKLARAVGVGSHILTGEPPEPSGSSAIPVVGFVQAGCWQEAIEWDISDWTSIDVPVPERFKSRSRALQVRGRSMDLEYPDGSYVVFIDMLDFRQPQDGDHLVVYAYHRDGRIEATLKELKVVDGKPWLWPRSSLPEFQQPVNIDSPGDGVDYIEIKGIVIGGYKPRIF